MTPSGATLHVLGADTRGGCESLSLSLARELERLEPGSQEVVFLSPLTGVISPHFESAGIVVHSCPASGRIEFMRAFAALCVRRQASSVLTHGFGRHVYTALAVPRVPRCRTIPLVQNPAPAERSPRLKTMVYAQLARPFVHRHVACSRYVADSMTREYGIPSREIVVVPNWCDVDQVRERAAAARAARGASEGPVLGMVARLDPIKDHDTALRAFAMFRAEVPAARFRIVGDGPLRRHLEEFARTLGVSEAVEFMGSRGDVFEQLGLLDIFCFATTAQEGFGIVLIEAMAAGVPIVCTDVGPCREVLQDGKAGMLVAPRDPASMARELKALWLDGPRRTKLADVAAATASRDYSSRASALLIRKLLRD